MRKIRSVYKAINGLKVEESYSAYCDNFFLRLKLTRVTYLIGCGIALGSVICRD